MEPPCIHMANGRFTVRHHGIWSDNRPEWAGGPGKPVAFAAHVLSETAGAAAGSTGGLNLVTRPA